MKSLDEDLLVYTFFNYLDYPLRKLWIFSLVSLFGIIVVGGFPIANLWTVPILGLAAYYNEIF